MTIRQKWVARFVGDKVERDEGLKKVSVAFQSHPLLDEVQVECFMTGEQGEDTLFRTSFFCDARVEADLDEVMNKVFSTLESEGMSVLGHTLAIGCETVSRYPKRPRADVDTHPNLVAFGEIVGSGPPDFL